MATAVSPSKESITAGQIGKVQELLGAALRKSGFQSEPTQQVLESRGDQLAAKLVGVVREFVEAVSILIVRLVSVDRARTPQAMLDATDRNQYVDKDVVKSMPKGEGAEVEVVFFNLGKWTSDDDLEREYELRGLKAADPYSLAAVNEADPVFADEHPNGTHWKNEKGQWCFATFGQWRGDGRDVDVYVHDNEWYDRWWFAGLRK
jgi:hypothetical protein